MEEEKKEKQHKRKIIWVSLLLLLLVTGLIVVFVLFFISNSRTYKVDFVSNCDTEVPSQEVKNGSLLEEPDVSKLGYTLHGWYKDNKEWNFESDKVKSDMTLTAKWDAIYYKLTIDYDGGAATNPTKYTIEDEVDLTPATKTGYTFVGYFDNDGNEVESIEKGTTGDINLKAQYSINTYKLKITYKEKWGTFTGAGDYVYNSDVTLSVTLNPTYEMIYWIDRENYNILSDKTSFTLKMPAKNLDVTITIKKYDFTITYIDEKNATNTNPTTWFTHTPLPLEGLECDDEDYVFAGWYDEDENLVTTLELDVAKNITLTAKWSFKPVTLTLSSTDEDLIVSGGGTYDYGSTVTLSIDDSKLDINQFFGGWYDSDDKFISGDRDYTFTITENMELHAVTIYDSYAIATVSKNHILETYYTSNKTPSHTYTYDYDDDGRLLLQAYESLTSDSSYGTSYEYDENGNLICKTSISNGLVSYMYLYTYDELNRLAKSEYKKSKSQVEPTSTETYIYEDDGESYSIKYTDASGSSRIKETHTISYKDGIRSEKIVLPNDHWYYIEKTRADGQPLSRTCYEVENDKEWSTGANVYYHTYDDNGLLVHTYGYSAEIYTTDYFYNENKQEIKNVKIIQGYSGWHYYTSTFYDSSSRISRVEKLNCVPPETGNPFSRNASRIIYEYVD